MRLLIVSDIHANIDALDSIGSRADAVAFLGDAVAYGPCPAECIDWLRARADYAVRGNHDNAVGFDEDPRCAPMFREMAEATRQLHMAMVEEDDRQYLRQLPLSAAFTFAGARFYAVHAAPTDPLFRYMPPDSTDADWLVETSGVAADVLLVGHTHHAFVRVSGRTLVVNPGSVGQPKHGDPHASFAVWEDGRVTLHRAAYRVERAISRLRSRSLPEDVLQQLIAALRTGGA